MSEDRVLEDFFGAWRFQRGISHASGEQMSAEGRADFSEEPEGLLYKEDAQMTLPDGKVLTATRSYLWREGLHVFFDDGRPFHTVPAAGGTAQHWCDPDMYRVAYDFSHWPVWRSAWTVKGPNKNYSMTTVYSRA